MEEQQRKMQTEIENMMHDLDKQYMRKLQVCFLYSCAIFRLI